MLEPPTTPDEIHAHTISEPVPPTDEIGPLPAPLALWASRDGSGDHDKSLRSKSVLYESEPVAGLVSKLHETCLNGRPNAENLLAI